MRAQKAFAHGIMSGLVLYVLMATGRLGGMEIHLDTMIATHLHIPSGPTRAYVGFIALMLFSGVAGLTYAWSFNHLTRGASAMRGMALAFFYSLALSFFFKLFPFLKAQVISFMFSQEVEHSPTYAMVFLSMYQLLFGAIFGYLQGKFTTSRSQASPRSAEMPPLNVLSSERCTDFQIKRREAATTPG